MFSEEQKRQREMTPAERMLLQEKSSEATKIYQERFDNVLFTKAIAGKTSYYANNLIDDALALCGDPWYTYSNFGYVQETRDFLALFENVLEKKLEEPKLYVWEGVFADYFPGLVVAVADNVNDARKAAIEKMSNVSGDEQHAESELSIQPDIYQLDRIVVVGVEGGG